VTDDESNLTRQKDELDELREMTRRDKRKSKEGVVMSDRARSELRSMGLRFED
jgi:hypothetical protein